MNITRVNETRWQLFAYILLTGILTYFVGMRDVDKGTDTFAYSMYFDFVKYGKYFEGVNRIEIGFYWLTKIITLFTDSKKVYFSIIFFIQIIGITSAIYKRSEMFKPYLLITLVWLSFPFFYSITLNVLRQGLAFVFVIYSIDAKLQNKKYFPYVLLLLGTLFHYATILYLICFLILELKPKPIVLLYWWFSAMLLSFLGIIVKFTRPLLEFALGHSHYSTYLDICLNPTSVLGFRLSFAIFSSLPIVYYLFQKKYNNEYQSVPQFLEFQFVLSLYLVLNIIYLVFADFAYNDRIALVAWLLMPLMININYLQRIKLLGFFTIAICFSSIVVTSYYLFL